MHTLAQTASTEDCAGVDVSPNSLREPTGTFKPDRFGDGQNQLHVAAKYDEFELVAKFLRMGAPVDAVDDMGNTALHFAANSGNEKICRLLIEHGASVNAQQGKLKTPLHLAAMGGHVGSCTALTESGANLDTHDGDGNVPLHWSAMLGFPAACKALIAQGAGVNAVRHKGETPLHLSAKYGHLYVTLLLIESGADLCAVDRSGNTAFVAAMRSTDPRKEDLGTALIAYGADASQCVTSLSALSMRQAAVRGGHVDRLVNLCKHHPSMDSRDDLAGLIELAGVHDQPEAASVLQSFLAIQSIESILNQTPNRVHHAG